MKKWLLLCWLWLGLVLSVSVHADVDYQIEAYEGELVIHDDNTATFKQRLTYVFESTYNGQYVTLGKAGQMPSGFDVLAVPTVLVYRQQEVLNPPVDIEALSDGYRVNVYQAGVSGDRLTLEVTWELANLLWLHDDVAELNWVPISDWDKSLEEVSLIIRTDRPAKEQGVFVHTGYFEREPQVFRKGQFYQVIAKDVSGVLELRAYWDRDIVSVPTGPSQVAKPLILAEEEQIRQRGAWLKVIYWRFLPQATGGIVLLVLVLFFVRCRSYVPVKARECAYQAPEVLHPLVLARWVYGASLRTPKNSMTFDHMIQASLLDLLDRGLVGIRAEEKDLLVYPQKVESALDKAVLAFLFGQKTQLPLNRLFQHYAVDERIFRQKRLTGSALQHAVRQRGQALERKMTVAIHQIDQLVLETMTNLGYTPCHRALTKAEIKQLKWPQKVLSVWLALIVIAGFVALFRAWSPAFWSSFALFVLCFGVLFVCRMATARLKANGVLRQDAVDTYQSWQAYANMFRTLGHFDQVEFESLVVWNHVLIYATLFGQAKRVHAYLNSQHIQLPHAALNTYVASHLYRSFNHSMKEYHAYQLTAVRAAHFSLPSSSYHGGFSGGGGGGGGGAF